MTYSRWIFFRALAEGVDLTPSTGKRGRPYSKNWQGIGDIIFVATTHIESVVLLGWKNVKKYTYTDYKPPVKPTVKGKATYQQIISYVQDHFTLKVSNLDIAQTKDKCGFQKRENYNKGKEGHKVPQVTKEKEQAIIEAFKYYNMM